MTEREKFEIRFPLPEGIFFSEEFNGYREVVGAYHYCTPLALKYKWKLEAWIARSEEND